MRLTFLITDLHRGGSPLLLADLAPALQKQGWDTDVLSIAPPGEISALLQSAGIPTSSLHARNNHDLATLPRLIRHLQARQPHILCSILLHANLLASLARPFLNPSDFNPNPNDLNLTLNLNPNPDVDPHLAPLPPIENQKSKIKNPPRPLFIHSLHTLQEKPRWHWLLQRLLLPCADAFIAPSHAIIHKLQSLAGKNPVPNPTVIPNGINVPRFQNAAPIATPPWPQDAIVIGSIARFDPVKRLPLLLQTMPLLPPNFHLALLGYGTQKQENQLRHLATTLDPPPAPANPPIPNSPFSIFYSQFSISSRIHFLGPTQEPERWYKSFNIYCSLSASEGFGLTLAEALCAGIPIVTCDTPAIRETLDHAAWLPENPTPRQIARALTTCAAQIPHLHTPAPAHNAELAPPANSEQNIPNYFAPAPQNSALFPPNSGLLEQRYGLKTMVEKYDACFRNLLAHP